MQNSDLVLGIDIGGTKTAFGFVNHTGIMISSASMPTDAGDSAETFVSRLHQLIEEVRAGLPSLHQLRGIGIGAPNANHHRGTIEKPVNLNWGGSPSTSSR